MPFPIRAVQVDRGSEFEAVFEEECQRRGIKLFVLPPRSPKLNGYVERAHRTHTGESYEVTDCPFEPLQFLQALDYLTPLQFLQQLKRDQRREVRCH